MKQVVSVADWQALWRVLAGTGAFGARPVRGAGRLVSSVARHGPTPYALVAWHALQRPHQTAIDAWDGVLTYYELQQAADALIRELRPVLQPGAKVGLLGRGGAHWLTGLLTATRLGAEVLLLNTLHSPQEWAEQVQSLNLSAVLHEPAYLAGLRSWPHAAALIDVSVTQGRPPSRPRRPGFGAVTLLTSGSTGTPRAIRRTTGLNRAQAVLTATDFLTRLNVRAGERVWLPPPLFHGQGLSAVMLTLGFGGTLILGPEPRPDALRVSLERTSPHWVIVVPTVLHRLLDGIAGPVDLPELRGVVSGSAALSPALASEARHAFRGRLFNLYGTTETGPISLAVPPDLQEPDNVGRVLNGVQVDLTGGTVTVQSPFLAVPDRCWSSGDLAEWSETGLLRLLGRADDRFICGGENVDPQALERRIETLPGVLECAVWGVPDDEYGQVPHALIVPRHADFDLSALRRELDAALPRTLRPRRVGVCAELPRNAAGKLVRRLLPDWGQGSVTLT